MSETEFTGAAFYDFLADHKLMGTRCKACGELYLPPRPICPHCGRANMEWTEFSGKGTLRSFSDVHIASTMMLEAGYGRENSHCSGVVHLAEGPSVSAQILGVDVSHPETININTPLTVEFVKRGEEGEQQTYLAFKVT
jgi:uncharacterized OB-fold protein